MNNKPKISVIVPVYNGSIYIEKCVKNILNQDYQNIEAIIIDDGSTDDTLNKLNYMKKMDNRIVIIHQRNAGVSAARNTGIQKSSGEYIVFMDVDDTVSNSYISKLFESKNQENQLVVCSHRLIKSRGRAIDFPYKEGLYENDELNCRILNIFREIAATPWGKLFEASLIKQNKICFPIDTPYGEDTIFLARYISHVSSIRIISDILYYYNFTNPNSAVKKTYRDLYLYCSFMIKEKEIMFRNRKSIELYENNKSNEIEYYLNVCLGHYITKYSKDEAIKLIEKSANCLAPVSTQYKYYYYIIKSDFKKLRKKWIKDNIKEYVVCVIKKHIKR